MSKTISPSTGVGWVRASWKIFKTYPLAVIGVVAFYMLMLLVSNMIGALTGLDSLGLILSSIVTPFGTVAFAVMGREITQGRRPNLMQCYREGWQDKAIRIKLILLGLIYGICVLANGWLGSLLSQSAVKNWKVVEGAVQIESILNNIPWTAIVICGIFYALILCITCFSPLLVLWKGQNIGKAFFFSLLLCLRNFLPILAFGSAVISLGIIGMVFFSMLASASGIFSIISGLWALFITSWFYCALWPMWETFFGPQSANN